MVPSNNNYNNNNNNNNNTTTTTATSTTTATTTNNGKVLSLSEMLSSTLLNRTGRSNSLLSQQQQQQPTTPVSPHPSTTTTTTTTSRSDSFNKRTRSVTQPIIHLSDDWSENDTSTHHHHHHHHLNDSSSSSLSSSSHFVDHDFEVIDYGHHHQTSGDEDNENRDGAATAAAAASVVVKRAVKLTPQEFEQIYGENTRFIQQLQVCALNRLRRNRLSHFIQRDESLKSARLRKNIVAELYSTESTYVQSLQTVRERFLLPIVEKKLIKTEEVNVLFGSIEQVLNVHVELLSFMKQELKKLEYDYIARLDLSQLKAGDAPVPQMGKLFVRFAPFLKMYTEYVNNFDAANDLYERLISKNRKFSQFVDKVSNPEHGGLPLPAYLIQPIQRIPRIRMLLEDLKNRTPVDHVDYANIDKGLSTILQTATFINEHKRQNDHSKELLQIQHRLHSGILLPHRRCVFAGTVNAKIEISEISSSLDAHSQQQQQQHKQSSSSYNIEITSSGSIISPIIPSPLELFSTARNKLNMMRQKQLFKIFLFSDLVILVDDPATAPDQRFSSEDDGVYLVYLLFSKLNSSGGSDNGSSELQQQHQQQHSLDDAVPPAPPIVLNGIFKGEAIQITIYSTTSSLGIRIPSHGASVMSTNQDQIQLRDQIATTIEQTRKHQVFNNRYNDVGVTSENEWLNICNSYLDLKHAVPMANNTLKTVKAKREQTNKTIMELETSVKKFRKKIEDMINMLNEQQNMLAQRIVDADVMQEHEELLAAEYDKISVEQERNNALIQAALNRDHYAFHSCFNGTKSSRHSQQPE